jgi:ferredoxin
MRLRLDSDKCQGHGRCYALAPELFDSDDEGYSVLKVTDEIPPELERAARLAVDNCPEFAIDVDG